MTPTNAELAAQDSRYATISAIYPPHARELVQALRHQRFDVDFDTCRFGVDGRLV